MINIFTANAGGGWDNAKKVVEVDLKEKGTALHGASRPLHRHRVRVRAAFLLCHADRISG